MDCLSRYVNKLMKKLYFVNHILVLGPLNGAKRAKNMAKGRQQYKIVTFEDNGAFEVL